MALDIFPLDDNIMNAEKEGRLPNAGNDMGWP